MGDDVYPTFLYDDGREMDLFNWISAPNHAKVKTGTHPRAAHEIGASKVPPTGHASTTGVASNKVIEEEDTANVPLMSKRRRKRVDDGANANAPSKVLRKDFDVSRPTLSTFGEKSFASTGLEAGSTLSAPASQETPAGTIDPDPSSKGTTVAEDPNSEKSSSFTSFAGWPGGIYQPGRGITNSCRFDTL
ncbi:hypothetical protein Tco_1558001, partial [Tanacetum coccineum]